MNEWKTKWQEFWQQGQDFLARIRKGVRCGEAPAEPSANEETSSQAEGTEASLGDRCVAFFREMSWKKGLVAAILVILLAGGISCLYLFFGFQILFMVRILVKILLTNSVHSFSFISVFGIKDNSVTVCLADGLVAKSYHI